MDGRVLVDPEFEYLLSMEDIDEEDDLPEHYEEE
jgi:hypothetical protein